MSLGIGYDQSLKILGAIQMSDKETIIEEEILIEEDEE